VDGNTLCGNQGLWWDEGEHLGLKMLPHVEGSTLTALRHHGISNLHQLLSFTADRIRGILKSIFVPSQVTDFMQVRVSKPLLHSRSVCMPAALILLGSLIVGHHSD